jgi:hypothetical protein
MEQFIVIGVMLSLMGYAAYLDAARNKHRDLVTEAPRKAHPERHRKQRELERAG